jgi:hypothetical protein
MSGRPHLLTIDQRKHGVGAIGFSSYDSALGELPDALEGPKRMLDLGAHSPLSAIGLLVRTGEWPVLVRPLVGEALGSRLGNS